MRLDLATTIEQRLELVDLIADELRAQTSLGAQEIDIKGSDPGPGEAFRVVVKSDLLPEPKTISVPESKR